MASRRHWRAEFRDIPEQLDVMHPGFDQDEIERSLAHDLVGDMDIAVLRVLGHG